MYRRKNLVFWQSLLMESIHIYIFKHATNLIFVNNDREQIVATYVAVPNFKYWEGFRAGNVNHTSLTLPGK